jgi:hypothetical protein
LPGIRIDGAKPDQLALQLATGFSKEAIFSGNHFTYRGTLSGSGQTLFHLVRHFLEKQVELEYMTAEDAGEYLIELQEDIKTSG